MIIRRCSQGHRVRLHRNTTPNAVRQKTYADGTVETLTYPSSGYDGLGYAAINPIGMIIGAVIMFGVLGFVPGWILAKILHAAGKLRIPREVELAGLDYNIMEAASKDERAVASSNR